MCSLIVQDLSYWTVNYGYSKVDRARQNKVYSNDLKWGIVWQHMAIGLKFTDIAKNFGISTGTSTVCNIGK